MKRKCLHKILVFEFVCSTDMKKFYSLKYNKKKDLVWAYGQIKIFWKQNTGKVTYQKRIDLPANPDLNFKMNKNILLFSLFNKILFTNRQTCLKHKMLAIDDGMRYVTFKFRIFN